jgi:hypothetical protein
MGLYVGADGLQPSWSGFIKHVNLIYGDYMNVALESVLEAAPKYNAHEPFEHYTRKLEEDEQKVISSPEEN